MIRSFIVTILLMLFIALQVSVSTGEESQVELTKAVQLLRSQYWSDRRDGAEMLKKLPASEIPAMIGLLDDSNDRVTAIIALELASRSEISCVSRLHDLLRNQTLRYYSMILPIIHKFGTAGYDEYLFSLLLDRNPDISRASASAIAKFALIEELSEGIFNRLADMILSTSFETRILAELIYSLIGEKAVPHLLNALGARFPTSFCAMNALVGIGGPAVVPLLEIVRSGNDGTLSLRAAMTLAQIRDESAEEAIRWLIINSTDPLVRTAAGYALRGFTGDTSLLFEVLINDADSRVRSAALHSLAFRDEWPAELLPAYVVARLGDISAEVRNNAVLTAGRHKLRDAIRLLPELFNDSSKSVMINALWTAGNFGEVEIIPDLLPFLIESDPSARLAAAKSLLQLGSSSGEQVIIQALGRNDEYSENALYALSFARDKAAVDQVVLILPRLKPETAELARYVLYSITGMILDKSEWPAWWTTYRQFWEYEQREGYLAFARGRTFQDSAMAHVATEFFTFAAANASTFPEAHFEYAKLLLSIADNISLELALMEIRKAIALLPQPRYYVVCVKVLIAMKRFDEAQQVVRTGLASSSSADVELEMLEKQILDRISR